jgi:hypothetical protein
MEKPAPSRRAASAFLPTIAAASTDSTRRNRFKMHAAHEAGAENSRSDRFHHVSLPLFQ